VKIDAQEWRATTNGDQTEARMVLLSYSQPSRKWWIEQKRASAGVPRKTITRHLEGRVQKPGCLGRYSPVLGKAFEETKVYVSYVICCHSNNHAASRVYRSLENK